MIDPRRGEVWFVRFDPSVGDEIRKTRPAIVLSASEFGILNLRYVVPLTDWKDRYELYPWITPVLPTSLNGLSKPSAADAFQSKSLSLERFEKKIGAVTQEQLREIAKTVGLCIGLASV